MYPQIKHNINELIIDPFGNYFLQKLIDKLHITYIKEMFELYFPNDFLDICLNQHGTRVVQKLLDKGYKDPNFLDNFNQCLHPNLMKLILNQNATHIIIKYVSLISYPKNQFIINFPGDEVQTISTNKHSCCTYQKCILLVGKLQQKKLIMSVVSIADLLFNNSFGNYLIQFVLNIEDNEANNIIISKYFSNFYYYVSQKCSSNVFEKCFEYCSSEMKNQIIENLCKPQIVEKLLFNMYGNYSKFIYMLIYIFL